jgi:HK97 family phage prohead protease
MSRNQWRNPKPTNRKTKIKMDNQEQRNSNIERRVWSAPLEIRGNKAESRTAGGMAAGYGMMADLGDFTEEIAPGAFQNADVSDVVVLFNHDTNIILGRNSAGTATVRATPAGLEYDFDAPESPNGENVLVAIRRGDVRQSSFGFTVAEGGTRSEVRDGRKHRIIERIGKVYDVSPVTFPAYPDTTVAKRSLGFTERHKETALEDQQAAQTEQDTNTLHLLDMELRLLEMES